MHLSIVIPVYNESATIVQVLHSVETVLSTLQLHAEIIVVNDASTDDTLQKIQQYKPLIASPLVLNHTSNLGKGASIQTAIHSCTGDIILIQDADLEYDPSDYNDLLIPFIKHKADVVYGSRFIGGKPHRILFYWHQLGNRILTGLSNMLTNLNLTDMEIGYKLFRKEILQNIQLREKRFGFEPEVTAKIARIPNIRIYEVGISYYGRTYAEGKKINWKDGFRAIYCILRYNLFS